jgi:hypothetical protein
MTLSELRREALAMATAGRCFRCGTRIPDQQAVLWAVENALLCRSCSDTSLPLAYRTRATLSGRLVRAYRGQRRLLATLRAYRTGEQP